MGHPPTSEQEVTAALAARSEAALSDADFRIGQQLRGMRAARRMSQADVAERVNLSFQQIQKYEAGQSRVTAAKLCELADVLGFPVTAFFSWTSHGQSAGASGLFSEDAWRVASLYDSIPSPQLRKQVLELVRCIAEE